MDATKPNYRPMGSRDEHYRTTNFTLTNLILSTSIVSRYWIKSSRFSPTPEIYIWRTFFNFHLPTCGISVGWFIVSGELVNSPIWAQYHPFPNVTRNVYAYGFQELQFSSLRATRLRTRIHLWVTNSVIPCLIHPDLALKHFLKTISDEGLVS